MKTKDERNGCIRFGSRVDLIWVSAASRRKHYDGHVDDRTDRERRAAGFLKGVDLSQDLSVTSLRSCAVRCRRFAARQPDPGRAELFRGLAASFEDHASLKERGLTAGGI